MIALSVEVPIACWRRGHAREYLETFEIPPPSTAFGFLLSLIGEVDRDRHRGARVATGIVGSPAISKVLRTVWRIKNGKDGMGNKENARPDWQELVTNARVIVLVDAGEDASTPDLETRVRAALANPSSVRRFGGLSLGESSHLVNAIDPLTELPPDSVLWLADPLGDVSAPVWVDHVGSSGSRYGSGRIGVASVIPAPPALCVVR
ncbi:MAG: type I-MYXAN CRISPR-associated protein Cas5/Cmx5/DevS [Myxococcota bacterium]